MRVWGSDFPRCSGQPARVPPVAVSGGAADNLSLPGDQQHILSIVWELVFGWNA